MPIIGWACPICRNPRAPLDHYEASDCGGRIHSDYAAAVLADNRKDRAEGVHVTTVLNCPRKSAIEQQADVYVDPLAYNSMIGGTGWHKLMEASSNRPELCEVEVAGVVDGVRLVGTIDRLHPPTAISDWKTTSEWAEKWLGKPKDEGGGMKAEHLAQMSLYAELVEQSQGWRPLHGVVWYRTHKTILPFAERLWTLEQTLDFRPLSGDLTVAQLLNEAASADNWQEMELAGQSMKYGAAKTACDYCSVREICWTENRKAPF